MTELQNKIEKFGLYEVQTGGGCTAYRKDTKLGHVLVTDDGGCAVPVRTSQVVLVGFYNSNDEDLGYLRTKFGDVLDGKVNLNKLPNNF